MVPLVFMVYTDFSYFSLGRRRSFPRSWYSQFCWNTCFENADLFQYDWYMMEQFEHNANFVFAYVWFCHCETWGEHTLPPAKPSHKGIQNPHTYQLLQFTTLYTIPIWRYNSHLISDNTPCTTSGPHPQTPSLPTPASTANFRSSHGKHVIFIVMLCISTI